MGASPPRNWVQRVTIEIPGPVNNQEKWEQYKKEVDDLIAHYKGSINAKVTEIVNVRMTGSGGPLPGNITVTKKKKKGKKRPKRKKR